MPLLQLERISKSFAGVRVLADVSFDLLPGEVHALVGENGAGKSTLMNIAAGAVAADGGRILWEGREVTLRSPRQAQDLGINYVHQELTLVPQLSVGENVFLGRHPSARLRWVRWGDIYGRAAELLASLGHPEIDPRQPAGELSIACRQLVEIARALAFQTRLIIMDEPTAPLSEHETERLFQTISSLQARGVGVIYISHRLKEIYQCAGRVTVLRDGRHIVTQAVAETDPDELVGYMVGRRGAQAFSPAASSATEAEALRIEHFTAKGKFQDVNFAVREGEIVGLAGLVGAGRTEVLEALFGAAERQGGAVYLGGRPIAIRSPEDAVRQRMALVPDDRKAKGLVLGGGLRFNAVLAAQRRYARRGLLLDTSRENELVTRLVKELRIRAASLEQPVMHLSGGNQQKVILARWLLAGARIYLLDEPTRGIDVAAKAEIYDLIRRLAAGGAAIVLVSSELEEILALADRILVMHRGRIAGELPRGAATQERIMRLATGGAL